MVLGAGLDCIDLEFLGTREVIATVLIHGRQGVALIDPGPSTTLPALQRALASRGFAVSDIRAILLTHIHLDHAGATGTLLADCPEATVYVHERGAAHLVNPGRLIASATRLYGADMERLWGEIRPVPAGRVHVLAGEPMERLTVVGHTFEWAYTPGHASHHVSYFLPDARMAFVGDTAGLCRPQSRIVLPATPPPDVDLETWRVSTERILAWNPDQIVLTHFGPQPAPRVHFSELWRRLTSWSEHVRKQLEAPGTDEDRVREFSDEVLRELARATNPGDAVGYERAGRFDFSWNGLARYWRTRAESPARRPGA